MYRFTPVIMWLLDYYNIQTLLNESALPLACLQIIEEKNLFVCNIVTRLRCCHHNFRKKRHMPPRIAICTDYI